MIDIASKLKRHCLAGRCPADRPALPRAAGLYLGAVALVAIALTVLLVARNGLGSGGWTTFSILAAATAASQFFIVRLPRDQSKHTSTVFVLAAVLILPVETLPLFALIQHLPEWLKVRHRWYIQGFNICNATISMLCGWSAARLAVEASGGSTAARFALAGAAACVAYVAAYQLLLGIVLRLARGHSLRETGVFGGESLSLELVFATLGVAVAGLWEANPWLVPFALTPLILLQRSLVLPVLKEEARADPKTGLVNARYFRIELDEAFGRAAREHVPIALMMVDLDLLREINNTHGHLAGDKVIEGVAEVFRRELRADDVAARFGGEEFCVLLHDTSLERALEVAERIRASVAGTPFHSETVSVPVRATVSIGVAAYPLHGRSADEVVHRADLAVYQAKSAGRNRVCAASPELELVAVGGA